MKKCSRVPPKHVAPVSTLEGITISCEPSNFGEIHAHDTATKAKLWSLQVYTIQYDQAKERDVQEDHIKTLKLDSGNLLVTSEKNKKFKVDLKTKAITSV